MLYKNYFNAIMMTSSLAQVAKLVDAGDSKSPAERCVGSSPTLGTTFKKTAQMSCFFTPMQIQTAFPSNLFTKRGNCRQHAHAIFLNLSPCHLHPSGCLYLPQRSMCIQSV